MHFLSAGKSPRPVIIPRFALNSRLNWGSCGKITSAMAEYSDSNLSETDTRAKLITPALHRCGWTEDMIRREETAGAIIKTSGGARRDSKKRTDYLLRVKVKDGLQPVAIALIEAKRSDQPPGAGMTQAKKYAARVNVPFVYSSNGHQFVEYDALRGKETDPQPMDKFPTPQSLQQRYEEVKKFKLTEEAARPMLSLYHGGEAGRRYYQDAAIRAALEKIALCKKNKKPPRILLNLATGAGKTYIAAHLLKRIDDAKQMNRALFLCDRDALRTQALEHLQNLFGNDAEKVEMMSNGDNLAQNARVHVATYQTLGIDGKTDEDAVSFARKHYPDNYFSHIIIDECHRSAWNSWRAILDRNPNAIHIGLTATPRGVQSSEEDKLIANNNYAYFGDPVYSYGLAQGAEDGYLALCEIDKIAVNVDQTGINIDEIMRHSPINHITGEPLTREELQKMYEKRDFENIIMLPGRVRAMCEDLLNKLTGKYGKLPPRHKTIIFCATRRHAQMVVRELNNMYAERQGDAGHAFFAFVCMSGEGGEELPSFRAENRSHHIAATVDLLSTGVDIPRVANIVFFRYLKSPVLFYQMIGRGARIDEPTGKFAFTVYDYTNATDLMDKEIFPAVDYSGGSDTEKTEHTPAPIAEVDGIAVYLADTGSYIVIQDENGELLRLSAEEYKARLSSRLSKHVASTDELRRLWANPKTRDELLTFLRGGQISPEMLSVVLNMREYDEFDILASCGYGVLPRTRIERAESFDYKNEEWLNEFPPEAKEVLRALARCFAIGGIGELENPAVFDTPAVIKAGGLKALSGNNPKEIIEETKKRLLG